MRGVIGVILLLLITASLGAQELRVKNVRFEDRVDTVLVMYDLDGRDDKQYEVSLSLSFDGGKTYTIYPDHVSGDVGRGVRPGLGKRMEWNLNEDYPAGLIGDRFVFAVTAETQRSRFRHVPYYVLGTGLVGGIVYYAFKREAKKQTDLIITVPAEY
jgi:hypothetical protein